MSADPDPADPDPADPDARGGDGPTVVTNDETEGGVEQVDRWADVARSTLVHEAVPTGRLDLIFVDRVDIQALNREHLGSDGPTDVLAFPLDGPVANAADPPTGADGLPSHLGDVVICPAVARQQAAGHCGTFEAEMSLLVVHGVLHVLGHDHAQPDETLVMQDRERQHLDRYGIVHPVPA